MSWARLLKRVFEIDIEHCPNCGGALKIVAAIKDPPVIVKILSPSGPAEPRPAACASLVFPFIPNDLIKQTRPPTQTDGPARSVFEGTHQNISNPKKTLI
jgi:hypothetical protein